ncbi:MAG: bifunctional heptose 7-phosphate kinase/heptose 1-phosphate adenyltransferase [Vulcanimicrobiota bacterium]
MEPRRAEEIVARFSNLHVLVVGDLMLDHWVWGSVTRISPEAPVPVVDVDRYTYTPGGAANVVSNLRALGARVSLVGAVGEDESGQRLRTILDEQGVAVDGVLVDPDRPTTLKTRIIAHSQQVVRADFERRTPLPEALLEQSHQWLSERITSFDGVFFSDYDKGLFRSPGSQKLLTTAAQRPTIAGPKPSNFEVFRGLGTITLNALEASAASGVETSSDELVEQAGRLLLERSGAQAVLVTRGEHGMTLFRQQQPSFTFPALASQVFDVSGAGDTVLTLVGLCAAVAAEPEEAVAIASHAAAVVVRKVGTATATPEEILRSISKTW